MSLFRIVSKRLIILTSALLIGLITYSQSIHQEQSMYYKELGFKTDAEYDAINGFKLIPTLKSASSCALTRMVYGWFPYWGGSTYLNFDYNLLSDFVYFSYEVDVYTGGAITTNGWSTSPAVDYALSQGVDVSLCITAFSNHAILYDNPTATNKLITDAVAMVKDRGGNGINIDFEAVSSNDKDKFTVFASQLADHLHSEIPGSILTIAMPAVEWSDKFDVIALREKVDFFVIMGYDYYYSGSAKAGPGDGLYSLEASYNYNLNRSITYWINKGIPEEQLVMGLPYYGREWGTVDDQVPSATVGGSANSNSRTYKYVKDNSTGYYSSANKRFDKNSFSSYYVFNNGSEWRQCWADDATDLSKRMDLINYRSLAGMGIWALGYDDGYNELWNLIQNKFTTCATQALEDSIYDAGGPAFNYYNNEDYTFTIAPPDVQQLLLSFTEFNLEDNYDFLYIYDGVGTTNLIGEYTGTVSPGVVVSSTGALTLNVRTDGATTKSGWTAYWSSFGGYILLDDFEVNTGHFDKDPNFSGSTVGIDDASTSQRVTTEARNSIGSLQVNIIDDAASSEVMKIRLLSGGGTPANNVSFSNDQTVSFWMKTSNANANATVRVWIDDSDGIEEVEAIAVINDGEWNQYSWDLSSVSLQAVTGNGTFDASEVTIDAIVFEPNTNTGDWMLYIDDVMVSNEGEIPPQNTYSTISEEVCESYTSPGGKIFTSSGSYKDTIPNAAGADSIITINLTVNTNTTSSISVDIAGSEYTSPSGNLYTEAGTYIDTIANAAGCDSIITIHLTFVSGINVTGQANILKVYPNPVSNYVTVELNQPNNCEIIIRGINGKILQKSQSNQLVTIIELDQYSAGIYLLQISNESFNKVIKLVKE